ncbi:hypothetical protein PGT21_029091 [Puccinia graminis f. sp. tritici]|uniref:Uncharacterized protein n=1 Tax=Puccinia graminis f. sp. tritici TaxID=56615 RepID=A0A5B0QPB3_PUCGR|nr:hypothetical protein PGT21_029091 [Puccinia graminis f. sp. tritici]
MRQWRGHSHANAAHSRESGLVLSSDQSCPRLLSLAALAAFYPPPLNFTAAKGEPIHPQTVCVVEPPVPTKQTTEQTSFANNRLLRSSGLNSLKLSLASRI